MKTGYVILGAAAIAGLVWYVKTRKATVVNDTTVKASTPATAPANTPLLTPSAVKESNINLPGTLIAPTSGNTGIVPPILKPSTITTGVMPKIAPAPAVTQRVLIVRTASGALVPSKIPVMQGLGNAFAFN